MKYFPFFLQLDKLPCLIVGGGTVAERKLDLLVKAKADITILSLEFTDYILELAKKNNITCKQVNIHQKYLKTKNINLSYLLQMMFL